MRLKLKCHVKKAMTTSYEKNIPRRFPVTRVRIPDTSTDEADIQLSRSYTITYADSSLNGIIWNIETSLVKSSPCEVMDDQKRKMFFSENVVEKFLAALMESEFELFLFCARFLRWRLRSFLPLAFLSSWVHQWFFKFEIFLVTLIGSFWKPLMNSTRQKRKREKRTQTSSQK